MRTGLCPIPLSKRPLNWLARRPDRRFGRRANHYNYNLVWAIWAHGMIFFRTYYNSYWIIIGPAAKELNNQPQIASQDFDNLGFQIRPSRQNRLIVSNCKRSPGLKAPCVCDLYVYIGEAKWDADLSCCNGGFTPSLGLVLWANTSIVSSAAKGTFALPLEFCTNQYYICSVKQLPGPSDQQSKLCRMGCHLVEGCSRMESFVIIHLHSFSSRICHGKLFLRQAFGSSCPLIFLGRW